MRGVETVAGAVATIAVIGSLSTATPAHASNYGIELRGTYRAISNGEWAQTSVGPHGAGGAMVYNDEPTKIQTWTVTSDCVSPIECTGEIRSDEGWTASLRFIGDFWLADRDIPNWEPCPDGTAAPAHQKFTFWAWNPATSQKIHTATDLVVGWERTLAPSGACGTNKPLAIQMPIRLEKLS